MRLLVKTHSSNGDYDGDCTFAVIEISDEDKKSILARRELHQMVYAKDCGINVLKFWDGSVTYYSHTEKLRELLLDEYSDDEVEDNLCDGTVLQLKEGVELPEEGAQRTECEQLIIAGDVFYWQAYPKHTTITIETETTTYEELLK